MTPALPRPSAAVVLLSELGGQLRVFMVRRHARSAFVPDVFVFPGGSVQEGDRECERQPGLCAIAPDGPTALGHGFRVAALRECFEEAGVLLARRNGVPLTLSAAEAARFAQHRLALQQGVADLQMVAVQEHLALATDALLHWSHWITPEAWPKRFDTHFFLAAMPAAQEAAADDLETTAGVWVRPEEALAAHRAGDFPLVFATAHQLEALLGLDSVAAALARFRGLAVRTMRPYVARHDGQERILLPEESLED